MSQCASGCGNGQIHEGGNDQPIVKCVSCGHKTCFQHKASWHTGLTCEEWDLTQQSLTSEIAHRGSRSDRTKERRAEELRASEEAIKKISKPCPNCARNIEKNGGWWVHQVFDAVEP